MKKTKPAAFEMSSADFKKLTQHYLKTGKELGYPSCCVKAFVKDVKNLYTKGSMKRSITREMWAFAGFVPCLKHAKYIEKFGYARLGDNINFRRSKTGYPHPFPLDKQMVLDAALREMVQIMNKVQTVPNVQSDKHEHKLNEDGICSECSKLEADFQSEAANETSASPDQPKA